MGNILFERGLLLLFLLGVLCFVGRVVCVGASGVMVWVCVLFCCVECGGNYMCGVMWVIGGCSIYVLRLTCAGGCVQVVGYGHSFVRLLWSVCCCGDVWGCCVLLWVGKGWMQSEVVGGC